MTGNSASFFLVLMAVGAGWRASPACGQTRSGPGNISAGFFAGIARPSDQAYRQIYGSTQFPVSVQATFRVYRGLHAFTGYEYVSRSGQAQALGAGATSQNDPLRFRMHAVKAGGLFVVPVRKWRLLAGAGVGLHNYLEKWEAAGVVTSGSKAGLIVQAGAEYPVFGRLSAAGRIEYSNAPIKAKSAAQFDANLGRLEFLLGLIFKLR